MTDPDRPVTRRELREELEVVLRTLATKDDLKAFATKDDLSSLRDELRTHFSVMIERLEATGKIFYDGLRAAQDETHSLVTRIAAEHGARLTSLETRVTRLENPPNRP